ncbi:SFI1 (YLL003W) [Zygosaccharomyces parabailii]|uniref:BN860_08680g1_1 n=1 Tax=Zygosaccharomyces bailii (strain CLIB 213 / ATCC 58445 / CBS 680 / BCRC 21525 / NBRC 1098 / NCYC 1416 / NRRL Y-2227) TaxID=1333698 RepID=A0A8J2X676_ZYGB2|nr:SFI1 (YLL003W) [Zygosaccharomyces parabailii]CDF88371.1 BN860_08680g1_1 [Zygosaccharomyces bailii CLIB 213]CDH14747.1 uncharacterized protein ZBAI_06533 [Zygosaccharomyces bailii ISA1307]
MNLNESTDSILKETEFARGTANASTETATEASTEALINEDFIASSTGSLVNKDVNDLLSQVFIQPAVEQGQFEEQNAPTYEVASNWNVPYDYKPARSFVDANINGIIENANKKLADVDPILLLVFNRIQVFLLRNGLSLEFLKIFKRYIKLLTESGFDPLEDQFLLSLQNELSESFEFSPVLEDILNKFLLKPENLIMKLALFEHNSALNLMRRCLKTWKLHYELKRSLQKLGRLWHEYLERKFLMRWIQKYEDCAVHWTIQAQKFNEFTVASCGFDRWLDRMDSFKAKEGLADHYFLNGIFQRIKTETNTIALAIKKAKDFEGRILLQKTTRAWRLNFRSSQAHDIDLFPKKRIFVMIRRKIKHFEALNDRADLLRYSLLLSPLIKNWNIKTQALANQSCHLAYLEKFTVKKKALGTWKMELKRKRQEYLAVSHLNEILVRFTFKELWLNKFRKHLHLYSFWNIQSEKAVKKFFIQWKKQFFMRMKADEFMQAHRLKTLIQTWRFQVQLKTFVANRKCTLFAHIFTNWSYRALEKKCIRQFSSSFVVKPIFGLWMSRQQEELHVKRLAISSHNQVLKIKFLSHWHQKLLFLKAMQQRAEILRKIRVITMLKRGIARYREVKKTEESFAKLLITKFFLARYFNIWKQQHILYRDDKLREFLENYVEEKNILLQRQLLILWNAKSRFYADDCCSRAVTVYQRSLQRSIFRKAERKMRHYEILVEKSSDFRKNYLLLNAFYSWTTHVNQLREINSRLEVEINRKNLALLLNYMNNWSIRILKSRRNYEAVQVFRKRWDRATVRGLLLVWKNRVEQSPTKRPDHTLQNVELKTPTRRLSPKGTNTIPGSEGVKMHRIEAMKSHYSRVRRAIPSPIKSSLSLNSAVKKKIETEENVFFATRAEQRQQQHQQRPPPRLSLEKINRNLASKIDRINFERIPEVRLEPFMNSDSRLNPVIDRSLLEVDDEDAEFDESPTRRS